MDILFKSKKFAKEFNTEELLARGRGSKMAKKIKIRLTQLRAVEKLEDMCNQPGRCHELKGNKAGQLSLDLDHPYRLIFEPTDNPPAIKEDGGIDWKKVKKVMILGVEDTHE